MAPSRAKLINDLKRLDSAFGLRYHWFLPGNRGCAILPPWIDIVDLSRVLAERAEAAYGYSRDETYIAILRTLRTLLPRHCSNLGSALIADYSLTIELLTGQLQNANGMECSPVQLESLRVTAMNIIAPLVREPTRTDYFQTPETEALITSILDLDQDAGRPAFIENTVAAWELWRIGIIRVAFDRIARLYVARLTDKGYLYAASRFWHPARQ